MIGSSRSRIAGYDDRMFQKVRQAGSGATAAGKKPVHPVEGAIDTPPDNASNPGSGEIGVQWL